MKNIQYSLAIFILIGFLQIHSHPLLASKYIEETKVLKTDSLHYEKKISEANTLYYSDTQKSKLIVDLLLLDSTLYSSRQVGYAHYLLGQIHRSERRYQKALEAGLKAIYSYSKNIEELDHELSHTYMLLGNCSRYLANHYEAINFLFKGLDNLPLNFNQEIETGLLINIGIIYAQINDFKNANTYYYEALNKTNETDTSNLIYIHNNLGHLLEKQKEFETSLYHYNIGLELANQKELQYFQLLININLANLYLSLDNLEHCEKQMNAAKKIMLTYKDRYLSAYFLIIESSLILQTCTENIQIDKIEQLIPELKSDGSLNLAHSALKVLKDYYSITGNYEKALFVNEEIEVLVEKLYNLENLRNTNQLTSDKLHRSELVELNINKKKLKLFFTYLILLISIFGAIFYFLYVKQKSKTSFIYKLLQDEKNNRAQLLKSTHSNYKKKLQNSNLAYADLIYEDISMQLHDDIASSLAGIRFSLSSIDLRENEPIISRAIRYLDELYFTTRNLSHTVHPSYDKPTDYRLALKEFFNCSAIPVLFDFPNETDLQKINPKIKAELFRIIKELITNANKHSEATKIDFSLTTDNEYVYCTFADNGKGFSNTQDGLGLKNIRKRIQLLDGVVQIRNKSPQGTLTNIKIPLYQSNVEKEVFPVIPDGSKMAM